MSDEARHDTQDSAHWLWRLDGTGWLDAATVELALAREHAGERRRSVTHARRAIGMALNGVLVSMHDRGWSKERSESAWGRSYLDHLRALATSDDPSVPLRTAGGEAVGPIIARVLAIPVVQSGGLVRLGRRPGEDVQALLADAEVLFTACERWVRNLD